ncbi:MAG: hypothetical protein AABX82_08675 [Nanoarchaeota archaeon]
MKELKEVLKKVTLEEMLLYPILIVDGFIQYGPALAYPIEIENGMIIYNAPDQDTNIINDYAGSFLPVIWGTCVLNQISRLVFKKPYHYEYTNPLLTTAVMVAIEMHQRYHKRTYDDTDVYAALAGGLVALGIGIASKYLKEKREKKR